MRTVLKYGLLMTLADSVWMLIDYRLDLPGAATIAVVIAVILAGLYLGIRERRDRDLGGSMTFEDAFLSGVYVTSAFAALDSVATYIVFALLRPVSGERSPAAMLLLTNVVVILVAGLLASAVLGAFLRRQARFPESHLPRAQAAAATASRFRSREDYERWKAGQTPQAPPAPAETGPAALAPAPEARQPAAGDRRNLGGRQRPYRALRLLAKLYSIFAPVVLIVMVLVGLVGLIRDAPVAEKVGSSAGLFLLGGLYYLLMTALADAIYILFDIARDTRQLREVAEEQQAQPG